jgi:2'-5' RNA ligase
VNNHNKLEEEFTHLQDHLRMDFGLPEKSATRQFHPHITIAHRDLSKEQFPLVWSYINEISVEELFLANNYSILKHNGQKWTILKSFYFPNF